MCNFEVAGGVSGHLTSMLLISQDPNTCFYCNSRKELSVTRELSKKKESITVIYKNNKCEIIIMNEIKLVIYKSGS